MVNSVEILVKPAKQQEIHKTNITQPSHMMAYQVSRRPRNVDLGISGSDMLEDRPVGLAGRTHARRDF